MEETGEVGGEGAVVIGAEVVDAGTGGLGLLAAEGVLLGGEGGVEFNGDGICGIVGDSKSISVQHYKISDQFCP